jgi:hypothetical protein
MLRTPRLVTGQAVGAGHFIALIVLEQVNAMIGGFLTIALPTAAWVRSDRPVRRPRRSGRTPTAGELRASAPPSPATDASTRPVPALRPVNEHRILAHVGRPSRWAGVEEGIEEYLTTRLSRGK